MAANGLWLMAHGRRQLLNQPLAVLSRAAEAAKHSPLPFSSLVKL